MCKALRALCACISHNLPANTEEKEKQSVSGLLWQCPSSGTGQGMMLRTDKPRVRKCCSFLIPLLWIRAPRTGSSCTPVFMVLSSVKVLVWHFFVFPADPLGMQKCLSACALNLLMIHSDSQTVGIIE